MVCRAPVAALRLAQLRAGGACRFLQLDDQPPSFVRCVLIAELPIHEPRHLVGTVLRRHGRRPARGRAGRRPTFNCAKAQGEVEKLICSDASLAALDRKLDEAYRAVSAKAKGKLATQLCDEQRGWVKGRNDCWKAKAKTWITAT
jgi:hypothetical protein